MQLPKIMVHYAFQGRIFFTTSPPPPPKKKTESHFSRVAASLSSLLGCFLVGAFCFFKFNPKNFSNFSQGLGVPGSHPKKHRNGSENPGFLGHAWIGWGKNLGTFIKGDGLGTPMSGHGTPFLHILGIVMGVVWE